MNKDIYSKLKTKYEGLFEELKVEFNSYNLAQLRIYDAHLKDKNITSMFKPKLVKTASGDVNATLFKKNNIIKQEKVKSNLMIFGSQSGYEAFKTATMKDFKLDTAERQIAHKEALKLLKKVKTGKQTKGLYLEGQYRTGKTYLASAIVNELVLEKTVAFVFVPDFVRSVSYTFGKEELEKQIALMKELDILVLDDLAGGNRSAWFRDSILLPIIQERLNNSKLVIITSNVTLYGLKEFFSFSPKDIISSGKTTAETDADRLIVRISELVTPVKLSKPVTTK